MRKSTIYLFVLGLAVVAMTALASAGLVVSAQNSNSSMTMSAPKNTNKAGTTRRRKKVTAAKPSGRCDPMKQEQADLSGTYTGKVKHGTEAAMDATLTITGNNFTMASGSDTKSGRVTAVTTCGYTAATFMMGDLTPPPPGPNPPPALPAMSLRAKKVGNNLTLTSVPGEPEKISFVSGSGAKKAPRKHRTTRKPKTGATPPPPAKQ